MGTYTWSYTTGISRYFCRWECQIEINIEFVRFCFNCFNSLLVPGYTIFGACGEDTFRRSEFSWLLPSDEKSEQKMAIFPTKRPANEQLERV